MIRAAASALALVLLVSGSAIVGAACAERDPLACRVLMRTGLAVLSLGSGIAVAGATW